jgi:1-acyl-sn-glycerol-3-phosphate acyltransferase
MGSVRARLAVLGIAQAARVLADSLLGMVVVLDSPATGAVGLQAAVAFVVPFLFLTPVTGVLANALPRRWVLVGATAFSLVAVALFALSGGAGWSCFPAGLGAALFHTTRLAMLPAAAEDARWSLPAVNGWFAALTPAAIVGGMVLGHGLVEPVRPLSFPVVGLLLGLNVLACLAVLPATFPSDAPRSEPALQAVVGFFPDLGRISRDRPALASLLGSTLFQALVTLSLPSPAVLMPVGAGTAFGCGVAALQEHPFRCLGLVPLGGLGVTAALGWAMTGSAPGPAPWLLLGFSAALAIVPLRSFYLAAVPPDARGNGMSLPAASVGVVLLPLIGWSGTAVPIVLAAIATLAALVILVRALLELMLSLALMAFYRIRPHGPGRHLVPTSGPLLVVANHSSYLDPFWLGKVLPRRLTPLMTSVFYDLPIIRPLMVYVIGAIRVPATPFRRAAPELAGAIEVLRRGGCVLIFPEAILRRQEEQLTRPFGQGVWRILEEVPGTPVVVCWIEGGWGSYASYRNGPPFKGKAPDWNRPIDIVIDEPHLLPADLLADQRATRRYLRERCLACRRLLGLPADASAERDEG